MYWACSAVLAYVAGGGGGGGGGDLAVTDNHLFQINNIHTPWGLV